MGVPAVLAESREGAGGPQAGRPPQGAAQRAEPAAAAEPPGLRPEWAPCTGFIRSDHKNQPNGGKP